MPNRENILAFRRLGEPIRQPQPDCQLSVVTEDQSNAAVAGDAGRDPCILPLASHQATQAFAWRELCNEPSSVPVQIRLGAARLELSNSDVPGPGTIVVLDRGVDEPVEIVVDGQIVGHGRLVVAQNKLAIEICRMENKSRKQPA
jgi:hypothetical protein